MGGNTFFFEWEVSLIQWLQGFMGPAGMALAEFFTFFGGETMLVAVFGLLYWCIDKRSARIIGTNLTLALILNPMIKNVALRRRPYFDHETIKCLRPVAPKADIYDISAQGYSFPSAHSADSAVLYGSLVTLWKKPAVRAAAFILPLLVGISRVVLGVHYPTDVLAGWLIGAGVIVISSLVQHRVQRKNLVNLAVFVIALSGIFFCRSDDYFTGIGMMAGFFIAIPFEERFVRFSETRKPLTCILRLAGGGALYFIVNTLCKLPFPKEFLESGTLGAHLVRSGRYMIVMFVLLGLYPMLFGRIHHRESKTVKS